IRISILLLITVNDWQSMSIFSLNSHICHIYILSFPTRRSSDLQDSNNDGIGDLPGLTSRLAYIKDLGADVIWLNPIYKSPDKDNGYDISDYRSIQPEYGTMDDFDKMLQRAHSLGLKIMMDLVVN